MLPFVSYVSFNKGSCFKFVVFDFWHFVQITKREKLNQMSTVETYFLVWGICCL